MAQQIAPPEWTLITVTFNNRAQLASCWADFDPSLAQWIVVDNGSSDGSAEVAARLGAEVVERGGNFGFSSSNNVGLARARGAYVAFVNPDVTLPLDSLPTLRASVDHFGGLVAPQLLNDDGTAQPNARGLPTVTQKLANRGLRAPWVRPHDYARAELDGPTYVAWTIGAAVAARRDTFRHLGAWDDGYFIYYEDHELGLRAWERGLTVVVDPRVRWRHTWQRETSGGVNLAAWRHELRSAARFYRRYPQLLSSRLARRARRLQGVRRRLWTPAEEPAA